MRRCWRRGCGHDREAHEHYRPGHDCSRCECPAWRWYPWWLRWLMARD